MFSFCVLAFLHIREGANRRFWEVFLLSRSRRSEFGRGKESFGFV